ncbi:MAG: pteridine reductase [Gammaproteobacteria bacterium]|nr:pteridine reductase [Gammaproteobacteria bacterium]
MQDRQIIATKVALVTGAARRIGAEIAETLHTAGMNVVLHYHTSQQEAESLSAKLNKKRSDSAIFLQADLTQMTALNELVSQAAAKWGSLDVLVNNASEFYTTELSQVTVAEWDDLMSCNLKAPFFLSLAARPYLKMQKGCIVNIADIHGERPMRDYSIYCISKAGLMMVTKALAKELGPDVRVNAVSPGAIMWPEGENSLTEKVKQKIIERTALQRAGAANEIAKAVLYLVRDADYVTGQVLAVDGGRSLLI